MVNFDNPQQMFKFIQRQIDETVASAERITEAAVKTGEQLTKHLTETRPTKKSGKAGRVDSGDMVGDISSEILESNDRRIVGEFGWLGTEKDYYVYQTATGFRHYLTGDFIEPTYALRDATAHVEELIDDWVRGGGK